MKMLLVLLSTTALLAACVRVSAPRPFEASEKPKLGMTRSAVAQYFASRDNETGSWSSFIKSDIVTEKGEMETYRYFWKPASYHTTHVPMLVWQMAFIENKLVSYSLIDPRTELPAQPSTIIVTPPPPAPRNDTIFLLH